MPRRPATGVDPGLYLSATPGAILPASGVSALAGKGPWMIEEQGMEMTYVRVPYYGQYVYSHSLSGPTATLSTVYTSLQTIIDVYYTVSKSYDWFTTSSFTQNQTFKFNPISTDAYGNSYGDMTASTLGPVGNVNTLRSWYNREPWDDTIHTETLETARGTGQYYSTHYPITLNEIGDGTTHFGDFNLRRPSYLAHSLAADTEFTLVGGTYLGYLIFGKYDVALESALLAIKYVDDIGNISSASKLFGIGSDFTTTLSPAGPGGTNIYVGVQDAGCPGYRSYRHDWSTL